MYKISVPVMNCNVIRNGRDRLLTELKRFDAERVFLALDTYETDAAKHAENMKVLADNCRFFKENGFEVGAWFWAFWLNNNTKYRTMRTITGKDVPYSMCPTDEAFVEFAQGYIKDIARTGVDIIMFDDDLRYGGWLRSVACLCDGHIAEINRITGEISTREELEYHINTGGKNKFRDAFLKANGDSFRKFAKAMRSAVDEVDPTIRMANCACLSAWDIDGVNAYELSRILAGNTKPLVRLIGAPYWALNSLRSCSLQDVVELERMESAWNQHNDIEIMAEGDAYPRPRTLCPASYLEGFDTAIRASGCTDGILKYGIDYCSNADYETGYAKYHERNRDVYAQIDDMFSGKTACGIRVYESAEKVADMVMPTKVNTEVKIQYLFCSKSAPTLAHNAIPTVYAGDGICGIVFDENARAMPLDALKNGLILDIAAAEILTGRGVDVGLKSIGAPAYGQEEHFLKDNNHISALNATVYDIKIRNNAEVLSNIKTARGIFPMSYRYENANGNRFLVLNINTRPEINSDFFSVLKHYSRARQYADQVQWLSGKKLPAFVYGFPHLYMQCKEGNGALAIGLWNFSADIAFAPVVELHKEYSEIRFINCSGELRGDKVYLTDIPAFAFAAIEVK